MQTGTQNITLRMPNHLLNLIRQAASKEGIRPGTWIKKTAVDTLKAEGLLILEKDIFPLRVDPSGIIITDSLAEDVDRFAQQWRAENPCDPE